jgi:YHS domain-containing protein
MLSQHLIQRTGTLLLALAALPAVAFGQSSGVNWRTNLDQAKMEAAQSGRLLLIHFTTKTCGPCRLLDQQVFSQPHVGSAIEQHFVPVRLDADHNVAIAKMFRIDRVPAEYIVTPEGKILANPPIPNQPGPYLEQLENMAQHFQQTIAAQATAPATPAGVNSAYANLPANSPYPATQSAQTPAPQVVQNLAAQQPAQPSVQAPPQTQVNPYTSAEATTNANGQAQNVYAAAPQQAQPHAAAPQQAATTNQAVAAQAPVTPTMPNNAMPNSYGHRSEAAVAASSPTLTPQKTQLPAGSPPLAFDGYCPVSLKTLNRWAEGDAQFGALHRGRTFLFAGPEQRDQFMANPDSFSPVFAGLDPVLLLDKQQSVEGSRALGYRYGDAFYLFSSEETKQKFATSPHTYAAGVRQAMNRIDAGAGGTVRR